jgi:hypothetical protein
MKKHGELLTSAVDTASRSNRFTLGERGLVHTEDEAGCASEPVWMLRRNESTFFSIQEIYLPVFRLVAIHTDLRVSRSLHEEHIETEGGKEHSVYTVTRPACYPVSAKFPNSGPFAHTYYRSQWATSYPKQLLLNVLPFFS